MEESLNMFDRKKGMMEKVKIERQTRETNIELSLRLYGSGSCNAKTPIGFFSHMIEAFAGNSLIDIYLDAKGDIWVDEHHTVEDIGIALGRALAKALGDKKGINRYGTAIIPMDESLASVSIDLAGRYAFVFDAEFSRDKVGDMPTELVYDFFDALAQNAKMALHIKLLNGRNDHHKIEAIFKAFGVALRKAMEPDPRRKGIPSTKGLL